MLRFLLGFILTFITFSPLDAQPLQLPAPYSDHMVLQRNRPLLLKGRAGAGQEVRLSFDGACHRTRTDSSGTFTFRLPARPAGGPYRLTFSCGAEVKTLNEVYIGEVWLCSGQSNMQFALKDCSTAAGDLAAADTLSRVHLYNMCAAFIPYREIWDAERISAVDRGGYIRTGRWEKCSAATAGSFSAIGFHVGRILARELGCHVGILANALDGCTTEGWIDRTTLQREVPEILEGNWTENPNIMSWSRHRAQYNLQKVDLQKHRHPYEPAYLYDAAIRPLEAYPVRGILWYQGESNAELVAMHERLFTALQHSWRQTWNDPELPFYFVQISSLAERPSWPEFRDSQRRLAEQLPYTYMTVSHDMGEADNIHPVRKRIIGERLASSVLHHTYGFQDITPSGPVPLRACLQTDGRLCLTFSEAEGLHLGKDTGAGDFEIAGQNGHFLPCPRLWTENSRLLLQLPAGIEHPCSIRFAYRDRSTAQLLNAAGLPCPTFKLSVNEQ